MNTGFAEAQRFKPDKMSGHNTPRNSENGGKRPLYPCFGVTLDQNGVTLGRLDPVSGYFALGTGVHWHITRYTLAHVTLSQGACDPVSGSHWTKVAHVTLFRGHFGTN
jgi:hypothetical protein